jgi:hypothetical protein
MAKPNWDIFTGETTVKVLKSGRVKVRLDIEYDNLVEAGIVFNNQEIGQIMNNPNRKFKLINKAS